MLPTHLEQFAVPRPMLDGQGFVRLVRVMGDDGFIVETARVTTGKGRSAHDFGGVRAGMEDPSKPGSGLCPRCKVCNVQQLSPDAAGVCVEGDRRFLRFMMAHRHTSPFEFAEAVFHLRIPMDAWRQMVRHRTASVSEYSTRYSPAVDAILTTPSEDWRLQATANRQGSAGAVAEWPLGYTQEGAPGAYLSAREQELHDLAREVYAERLSFGVAKEQARKDLPLSNYTDVYWKCDLHNLLHFLSLRMDEHAQHEIRQYANAIGEIVAAWCPLIWGAFEEYRLHAVTFSRSEMEALRRIVREFETLRGYTELPELNPGELLPGGATVRERQDFARKLGVES